MVPGGARFISFHGIREIQDSVGGGKAVRVRFRFDKKIAAPG